MKEAAQPTVLVGHPFAPIGMGEVLRSTFRALREAQVPVRILDVYGATNSDPDLEAELEPFLTDRAGPDANVFCINGDEVAPCLAHLGPRALGGRRIIYPAWELPRYPEPWARELERFDEVWGFSSYTRDSLATSVQTPVHHLPLPSQPRRPRPLGRVRFGIPDTCYAFLFFFDLRSYINRKNPFGVLEAFRRVLAARPGADIRLVVKLNGSDQHEEQGRAFHESVAAFHHHVILIDRTMTDSEVKALHLCCDAFVSLHRCEGFGFGLAEAMYFGRPVIATGYSGNMDFMTPETSHPVRYRLVPVPAGDYPHWEDQVWAEPDVEQAADAMIALADDPECGRILGAAASRHMRINFSYRAAGLRYAARLGIYDPDIAAAATSKAPSPGPNGTNALAAAESAADSGAAEDVFSALRMLPIEEFGKVMIRMPDPVLPKLSAVLPRMASEQIQRDWTGNAGVPLLMQTLSFVRSVERHFVALTGRPLQGGTILDYGCGYGRILRLMYYFSDPALTFGVDPWDRSIEICRTDRIPSRLEVSHYLPHDLPVGNASFDLVYAFSVFTHTSEQATRTALAAIRKYVEPNGVFALTIRPREYWATLADAGHETEAARMFADHDRIGFAFTPHDREPVEGDVTYGDTSISLEWLEENATGWRVAGSDHRPDDPLQVIVYLTPM